MPDFLSLPSLQRADSAQISQYSRLSPNNSKLVITPASTSSRAHGHTKDRQSPGPIVKQYTLVLDLDETLVNYDDKIKTFEPRPYARKFLKHMSKHWDIVVFTAGLKDYADKILDELDTGNRYISRRLYRDSCKYIEGFFVKDISILGCDLSKVVIVDNIPYNFALQ